MGWGQLEDRWADASGRRGTTVGFGMLWTAGAVLAVTLACGRLPAGEFVGDEPLAVRHAIGDGIHAYHAGDYGRAYDVLTDAIEAGTDDPRGYYYRGLASLRLGRMSEADADFTTGADRELATGSVRRVSLSLERVQGPDRLTLERFRARARLGELQRDREAHGRRYSTIEDATGDVRRRRRPEDIRPELVAPRGDQPSLEPVVEEVPAPAVKPAAPAKPGATFEDEPAAESDDPFGDAPAPTKRMSKAERDETEPAEESSSESENGAADRAVLTEVEEASAQ